MKKLFYLLAVTLLAGTMFTSCSKDDDESASFSFAGDAGYISADATVSPGSDMKFRWTVTSPVSMSYIIITNDEGAPIKNTPWDLDNDQKSTYIDSVTITAPSNAGNYTYTFTVYDKDDKEIITKSIAITVSSGITEYASIVFGDVNNATIGSFCDADAGTIYLQAAAKTNATLVDLAYYYGVTNNRTIAAPSNADAISVFNQGTSALSTWSVKNATKFTAALTVDYTTIEDASDINAAITATPANDDIKNLTVGSVFGFETVGGKLGIAKVIAADGSASGSGTLTLSIKIEE